MFYLLKSADSLAVSFLQYISQSKIYTRILQFHGPGRGGTTWTGDFKCREVKTGFFRKRRMKTGSSGTLIGWKSGQTTYVPLWDRMEGALLWSLVRGHLAHLWDLIFIPKIYFWYPHMARVKKFMWDHFSPNCILCKMYPFVSRLLFRLVIWDFVWNSASIYCKKTARQIIELNLDLSNFEHPKSLLTLDN